MPARFYEQEVDAKLKNRRALSKYLDELVQEHLSGVKQIKLTYIFCSDEYLLNINKEFLNHDTYTDIVTFDLGEYQDEMIGEIYISIDRVAENASKFGKTYQDELHRVIFHGALHLCGYKDKTQEQKNEMRQAEDKCLAAYLN